MNVLDAWPSWCICLRCCFAENLNGVRITKIARYKIGIEGHWLILTTWEAVASLDPYLLATVFGPCKGGNSTFEKLEKSTTNRFILFVLLLLQHLFSFLQSLNILKLYSLSEKRVLSPPYPHSECWGRLLLTRCCFYPPAPQHPCCDV